MTAHVGTVNIRVTLDGDTALQALRRVINRGRPRLLGVLEWDGPVPGPGDLPHGCTAARPDRKGGKLVVWDGIRYRLRNIYTRHLVGPEFVGHLPGRRSRLEANRATVAEFDDLLTGRNIILVVGHLTAEVQYGKGYRRGWRHALRVRRHRRELAALTAIAEQASARPGRPEVYIVGDLNFDGLTHLGHLIACWVGHKKAEADGTLGNRTVDYVFADRLADDVDTISNASDHDGVVARYR